ncbi:MAG: glycoside hydrolase family 27 protein [Clostridia bacterium]|nr:glycoside hydrolase family 27 protein [Clostridia bacterium]
MTVNKPPMGWNSWNTFGESINETLILEMADFIVENGFRDAGYEYVVVDDCWALKERVNGKLAYDPEKFPRGMKYLSDKLHEKGLKFGMYSCSGLITCAGYPSSFGYEWTDAKTFAEWGVDFLKYDYCFKPHNRTGEELYRTMGLALKNSGRDILFSACSWGADQTHQWIRSTGAHTWRSTQDIHDNFQSVTDLFNAQLSILPYGGKNCFNDMDMLVVGMNGKGNVGLGGCTETQYKTHFAAWCMLQSPLMIGCDLRNADEGALALLKNKILIEIDQDESCAQTYRLANNHWGVPEKMHVLVRPLENGDLAIGFFNFGEDERIFQVALTDLGIDVNAGKTLELTDCWEEKISYPFNNLVRRALGAGESVVYRAKIVDRKDQ